MEQKKRLKRIEMIIKMVNEFKPTIIHFARPNPMQISACMWIYCWTKKLENQDWACRAIVDHGPSSCGLLGHRPAFSKTLPKMFSKHSGSISACYLK